MMKRNILFFFLSLLFALAPYAVSAQVLPAILTGSIPSTLGVWNLQGTILSNAEQPNVVYEGNAQLLSGTVFKMWYAQGSVGSSSVYYAESTDGKTWTQYSSNPILASGWGVKVFEHGGTYYMYVSSAGFPATHIDVYTSTDGIHFTLAQANAIVTGGTGSWDSYSVMQLGVLTVDASGTWWGYYTGISGSNEPNGWQVGLATSTDGIHWTISSGNPIPSLDSGPGWIGSGNFTFATVNGKYYGWSQTTFTGAPGATTQMPSDIMRWSATNPAGPWTALGTPTLYRTLPSEGIGTQLGQVADPAILQANGNVYMWYSADPVGITGDGYFINMAIAPGMTLAQLVRTYEGIVNIPIPTNKGLALNLRALAGDNFNRPDANPIGGNWTQQFNSTGGSPARIVSHLALSATTGTGNSFWNARSFPANQWSSVTVANLGASTDYAGVMLRAATNDTQNYYGIYEGEAAFGGTGTAAMQKFTDGVYGNLGSTTYTPENGDVVTGSVVSSTLALYINGYLWSVATDTTFSSGSSGFLVVDNGSLSNWQSGMFVQHPY